MIHYHLLLFGIALVSTAVILKPLQGMLAVPGATKPNYAGQMIPNSLGISFLLGAGLSLLLFWGGQQLAATAVQSPVETTRLFFFLTTVGLIALVGLLDDLVGSRVDSGLKGHFRRLLQGQLTTGGLKALTGGMVALAASLYHTTQIGPLIVGTVVAALFTNSVNLLDLRPGRAAKGYLLAAVLLGLVGLNRPEAFGVWVVTGSMLAYLPLDLRARAMMGDAGSNVLGLTLGITAVWLLSFYTQLILAGLLIIFHLFTEKYSLTKIIAKSSILSYLDRLGRSDL